MSAGPTWVLLKTAPDQLIAEMWVQLLLERGIPAMIRPADAISFLGISSMPVGVLVQEGRVGEARSALESALGGETLAGDAF